MNSMNSDRGGAESGRKYEAFFNLETGQWHRGPDRRKDLGSLFGGYSGPERRSGRERRESQARAS
jgi:hypothetical protein